MNRQLPCRRWLVSFATGLLLTLVLLAPAFSADPTKKQFCRFHDGYAFQFPWKPGTRLPTRLIILNTRWGEHGLDYSVMPVNRIIENGTITAYNFFVIDDDRLEHLVWNSDLASLKAYAEKNPGYVFSFDIHTNISSELLGFLKAEAAIPKILEADPHWYNIDLETWTGNFMAAQLSFKFYSNKKPVDIASVKLDRSAWYNRSGTQDGSCRRVDVTYPLKEAEEKNYGRDDRGYIRQTVFLGKFLEEIMHTQQAVLSDFRERSAEMTITASATANSDAPTSLSSPVSPDKRKKPRVSVKISGDPGIPGDPKIPHQLFQKGVLCVDRFGQFLEEEEVEKNLHFRAKGRVSTISAPKRLAGSQCAMQIVVKDPTHQTRLPYLREIMFRFPSNGSRNYSLPDLFPPNKVSFVHLYRAGDLIWATAGGRTSTASITPLASRSIRAIRRSGFRLLEKLEKKEKTHRNLVFLPRDPRELFIFDIFIPGFQPVFSYRLKMNMFDGPRIKLKLPRSGVVRVRAVDHLTGNVSELPEPYFDKLLISLDGKKYVPPAFHLDDQGNKVAHIINTSESRQAWLKLKPGGDTELFSSRVTIEDGKLIPINFRPSRKLIRLLIEDQNGDVPALNRTEVTIRHHGKTFAIKGTDHRGRYITDLRIANGETFQVGITNSKYQTQNAKFRVKNDKPDYKLVLLPSASRNLPEPPTRSESPPPQLPAIGVSDVTLRLNYRAHGKVQPLSSEPTKIVLLDHDRQVGSFKGDDSGLYRISSKVEQWRKPRVLIAYPGIRSVDQPLSDVQSDNRIVEDITLAFDQPLLHIAFDPNQIFKRATFETGLGSYEIFVKKFHEFIKKLTLTPRVLENLDITARRDWSKHWGWKTLDIWRQQAGLRAPTTNWSYTVPFDVVSNKLAGQQMAAQLIKNARPTDHPAVPVEAAFSKFIEFAKGFDLAPATHGVKGFLIFLQGIGDDPLSERTLNQIDQALGKNGLRAVVFGFSEDNKESEYRPPRHILENFIWLGFPLATEYRRDRYDTVFRIAEQAITRLLGLDKK